MNGPQPRASRWLAIAALLAVVFLLPEVVTNRFQLFMLVSSAIWAIVALGLDLLVGYTGYVSFGHAAFYGIGAYTSGLLVVSLGWSFWLALPVAVAFTALLALLVGWPTLRLSGAYFAIGTLAFAEITYTIINNWTSVTKGVYGLSGIPAPDPIRLGSIAITFDSTRSYYYLVYVFLVLVALLLYGIVRSPVGATLIAIRENEAFARAVGIDVRPYKLFAFTVASAIAGLGGSLFAHLSSFASPDNFATRNSLEFFVIVIFGGSGTLIGPGLAAYFLNFLSQALQAFQEVRMVVYGLILILVMMFMNRGLAGVIEAIRRRRLAEIGRRIQTWKRAQWQPSKPAD